MRSLKSYFSTHPTIRLLNAYTIPHLLASLVGSVFTIGLADVDGAFVELGCEFTGPKTKPPEDEGGDVGGGGEGIGGEGLTRLIGERGVVIDEKTNDPGCGIVDGAVVVPVNEANTKEGQQT